MAIDGSGTGDGGGFLGLTGSGVNNHIVRFDGTNKIQNSLSILDDDGSLHVQNSGATDIFHVDTANEQVIFTATLTDTGNLTAATNSFTLTTTANDSGYHEALSNVMTYSSTDQLTNTSSGLTAIANLVDIDAAGTVDRLVVSDNEFSVRAAATIPDAVGVLSSMDQSLATVTDFAAFEAKITNGSASNMYCLRFDTNFVTTNGLNVEYAGAVRYLPISLAGTGITHPINSQLVFAVTDQGAGNDNNGAGIIMLGDDGGSQTTGGDGGNIEIRGGDAKGSGNNNGGNISLVPGAGINTGIGGLVSISKTMDTSASTSTSLLQSTYTISPPANNAQSHFAHYFNWTHDNAFDLTNASAGSANVIIDTISNGTGDIANLSGCGSLFTTSAANTITRFSFYEALPYVDTATTVTEMFGITFEQENGTGSASEYYAFNLASEWHTGTGVNVRHGGVKKTMPVKAVGSVSLGVGATTFAVDEEVMTVTGDGGGNTIATITGGYAGQTLTLIFTDGLVTITDDNTHAANSVDLSAAFTSADDTVLQLVYDGTSWYECSRSTN